MRHWPFLKKSPSASGQLPGRTKAALASGLFIVIAGAGLVGPSITSVFAIEDDYSANLRMLRSERGQLAPARHYPGGAPFAYAPAPMLRNFGPFDGSGSLRPRHAVAKPARANPSRGSAPQSSPARGNDDPSAAGLSRRSVCVRLCDGYFFPVGDYSGSSDDDAHQAICSGLCPGAPTRLFVMPSGSDKIEDAISAREKRPYTALPVAFRHTTKHDNTCSCRAQEASVNDSVSLLKDFTLRRGDRIMTGQGFRVFLGSSNRVFKQNDFVSLAQFREIDSHERGSLQAIEKASGVNHAPVALISPKKADAKAIPLTIAPARTFTDSHGKTVRMIGPQAWMANGDAKAD